MPSKTIELVVFKCQEKELIVMPIRIIELIDRIKILLTSMYRSDGKHEYVVLYKLKK